MNETHYHPIIAGESRGLTLSHCHADAPPGHVHGPKRVYPLRADGGYDEELGPSTNDPPEIPPETLALIAGIVAQAQIRRREDETRARRRGRGAS